VRALKSPRSAGARRCGRGKEAGSPVTLRGYCAVEKSGRRRRWQNSEPRSGEFELRWPAQGGGGGGIKADGRSFGSEIQRSPPGNSANALERLDRHKPAAPLGAKLPRQLCKRFGQIGSAQSRCSLGLTLQAAAGYPRSLRDSWHVFIPLPCSSQWTALPCYQVPDRLGGSARKTKKRGVYRTKSDRMGTG